MANLSVKSFDEEIHALERRIAVDRIALAHSVTDCRNGLRALLTSPKALLTLTAVGFGAGRMIFGKEQKNQSDKTISRGGFIGLALGVIGALVRPRLGVGGLVSLAGHYLRKRRDAARASAASSG